MPQPQIQPGIYRHYKGHRYQVLGLVRHSETEEWLVLYKTLYGDFSSWVRPFAMFTGTVNADAMEGNLIDQMGMTHAFRGVRAPKLLYP